MQSLRDSAPTQGNEVRVRRKERRLLVALLRTASREDSVLLTRGGLIGVRWPALIHLRPKNIDDDYTFQKTQSGRTQRVRSQMKQVCWSSNSRELDASTSGTTCSYYVFLSTNTRIRLTTCLAWL